MERNEYLGTFFFKWKGMGKKSTQSEPQHTAAGNKSYCIDIEYVYISHHVTTAATELARGSGLGAFSCCEGACSLFVHYRTSRRTGHLQKLGLRKDGF